MTEYGQKLNALTSLDSALTVGFGSSVNGTAKDIGANTSPQAVKVVAEFGTSQGGTNDIPDLEVVLQHSDDNASWPADDQGTPIFNWKGTTAGEDLSRSEVVSFVPQLRYFRFRYTNNNASDSMFVNGNVALQTMRDDAV